MYGLFQINLPYKSIHLETEYEAPQKALFKSSKTVQSAGEATTKSSTSVRVEQSGASAKGVQSTADTKVEVNGRKILVDKDGSIHKVIRSGSQQTTLDISSNSQSSNSSSSSLDVSVESSSENTSGD